MYVIDTTRNLKEVARLERDEGSQYPFEGDLLQYPFMRRRLFSVKVRTRTNLVDYHYILDLFNVFSDKKYAKNISMNLSCLFFDISKFSSASKKFMVKIRIGKN